MPSGGEAAPGQWQSGTKGKVLGLDSVSLSTMELALTEQHQLSRRALQTSSLVFSRRQTPGETVGPSDLPSASAVVAHSLGLTEACRRSLDPLRHPSQPHA